MNEIAILKAVLMEILDDDVGIYPKAFVSKYEKRTDYMEGWNAAMMKQSKRLIEIFEEYGVTAIGEDITLKTWADPPR